MDLHLKGRVALITGASKGIGRAVAEVLAAEGCDLVLVARDAGRLSEAAGEIARRHGVKVATIAADIADEGEAARLTAEAGPVDILVNNAGAIPRGSILDVDEQAWRAGWDLKVFGYVRLCRLFLPKMFERGKGVVLNVIGVAGERPDANYVATTSANAALMMLTQSLGGDSVRHGVRVVGVNPGLVATDRFLGNIKRRAGIALGDADRWREMIDLPMGRVAEPREIADVVAFLVSDRASYISGSVVTVDGGLRARPPAGV